MLLKFSIVVLTTVDSILKFPAMLPTQISCCLILARPLVTTYLKFFSHIVPCFWNDLPSEFCKLTIPPSSLPKSPTIICFGLLSLSPLRLATRDCVISSRIRTLTHLTLTHLIYCLPSLALNDTCQIATLPPLTSWKLDSYHLFDYPFDHDSVSAQYSQLSWYPVLSFRVALKKFGGYDYDFTS